MDSSISTIGTAISGKMINGWIHRIGLSSEYKHLDELHKMMVLKLKDIHQQIMREGNDWFDTRHDICKRIGK